MSFDFLTSFLLTTEDTIEFFRTHVMLQEAQLCPRCDRLFSQIRDTREIDGCVFRCPGCRTKRSIRTGSYFFGHKLSLRQFALVIYCWSMKFTNEQTAIFARVHPNTVVDHYNFLREVCSWTILRDDSLGDMRLGGVGCVVQVDESVVYRAKYNRGHALYSPTKWVVGMYDASTKLGAAFFVESRDADTLSGLIRCYVKPGSTIHTDEWRGYSGVGQLDVDPPYIHRTVNHSKYFVDPETGVHTQNIEAYWCSLKRKFKVINGTSRALTASYIDEHMYRQRYCPNNEGAFSSILRHIAEKYTFTSE